MSSDTLTRPEDSKTDTGSPKVAHIVKRSGLTDAYVFGREVEALCGHRWVPTRDPKDLPVCAECKAIAEAAGGSVPTS